MTNWHSLWFALVVLWTAPLSIQASIIAGGQGTTISQYGIDDENVATTMDAAFVLDPTEVLNGLSGFGTFWVAGLTGPAHGLSPISSTDFSLDVYKPWVVNNNPLANSILAPNGINYNRGVFQQDAGGADFLLRYTPIVPSDPTTINFIQVYVESDNGAGFGQPQLDNFGSPTNPYYNQGGHAAGVGTTYGVSPLIIPPGPGNYAWLADIPYRCENGPPPYINAPNCQLGADDTILSHVQTFQTWIEAPTDIDGTSYNVLYGGIQWGYEYLNYDITSPEPSTIVLLAAGLAPVVAKVYRRRKTAIS